MVDLQMHELWPGTSVFCCRGKQMCGYFLFSANIRRSLLTYLLILLPGVLLIVLCIEIDFLLACAGGVALGLDLVFLCMASGRDPGYIMRQVAPFAKGPLDSPTVSFVLQSALPQRSPIDSEQVVVPYQSSLMPLKYCRTCKC